MKTLSLIRYLVPNYIRGPRGRNLDGTRSRWGGRLYKCVSKLIHAPITRSESVLTKSSGEWRAKKGKKRSKNVARVGEKDTTTRRRSQGVHK